MNKKNIAENIQLVFTIIALILVFSKNKTISIISGSFLTIDTFVLIYLNYSNKNKALRELTNVYMICKERTNSKLLSSTLIVINCFLGLSSGYFKNGIQIFCIALIISNILELIRYVKGVATIGDDKIIFCDSTIIDFSQIISVEYKHQYISTGKNKIITIKTKDFKRNIAVDSKDDKLKSYLEENILSS